VACWPCCRPPNKASELVREIPFAARTTLLVFDMKVVLLTAIFVYAFFRFTWSLRQYSFGALLVAAAPDRTPPGATTPSASLCQPRRPHDGHGRGELQRRPARLLHVLCGLAWFFSPWALVAGTAAVVWILYRREFHSEVLGVLADDPAV
jgi:uncharacterized membrane protein